MPEVATQSYDDLPPLDPQTRPGSHVGAESGMGIEEGDAPSEAQGTGRSRDGWVLSDDDPNGAFADREFAEEDDRSPPRDAAQPLLGSKGCAGDGDGNEDRWSRKNGTQNDSEPARIPSPSGSFLLELERQVRTELGVRPRRYSSDVVGEKGCTQTRLRRYGQGIGVFDWTPNCSRWDCPSHSVQTRRAPTLDLLLTTINPACAPHLAVLDLPSDAKHSSFRQQLRRKHLDLILTIGTTDSDRHRRYLLAAPPDASRGWERIGRWPIADPIPESDVAETLARLLYDANVEQTWPSAMKGKSPQGPSDVVSVPYAEDEEHEQVMAQLGVAARDGTWSSTEFKERYWAALEQVRGIEW